MDVRDGAPRPRVVVLGGGFGGLYAARALKRAPVDVTLVDRRNHHLFQPLLYQVATAGLAAPDVSAPIRRVLARQRNATVLLGEAERVDVADRVLVLADGERLPYDFLVVAAGARTSWFGREDWERRAPGLKTLEDAFEIRRRILLAFERAERATDEDERRALLSFVVIGAGPTGVELAGAVQEIAQRTLTRDFRRFDPRSTRVTLLDAADRVLPTFPADLSERAGAILRRMGVDVRTGARVADVRSDGVELEGGEVVAARTVLWAAGVRAEPIAATLGAPLERDGRVRVEPDLSIPGHPEVFVVGDLAAVPWRDGTVPGMAPGAIQMGRHAARSVARALRGEAPLPFRYRHRGLLATIGRSKAVASIGRLRIAGFPAWVLWLWVHLFFLIGFRDRVAVMLEWTWAYFTWQRSARVILDPPRRAE